MSPWICYGTFVPFGNGDFDARGQTSEHQETLCYTEKTLHWSVKLVCWYIPVLSGTRHPHCLQGNRNAKLFIYGSMVLVQNPTLGFSRKLQLHRLVNFLVACCHLPLPSHIQNRENSSNQKDDADDKACDF